VNSSNGDMRIRAEMQNVTLSLPKPLLKRARILAAAEDKSVSELIREALENRLSESMEYSAARERQLRALREGMDLGTKGALGISKEEMHNRE
jgi:Arc/MetJ-type ribon-helix-helix transcriptional regulator